MARTTFPLNWKMGVLLPAWQWQSTVSFHAQITYNWSLGRFRLLIMVHGICIVYIVRSGIKLAAICPEPGTTCVCHIQKQTDWLQPASAPICIWSLGMLGMGWAIASAEWTYWATARLHAQNLLSCSVTCGYCLPLMKVRTAPEVRKT